jgi:hypothetical protein
VTAQSIEERERINSRAKAHSIGSLYSKDLKLKKEEEEEEE